jgi:hypothetical protein
MILGIDIEFRIENSRPYTVQVKPLYELQEMRTCYNVIISGVFKPYQVDYLWLL